tara:strand:- start:950 stop:1573 length:624 start_codon:yes stop_codon:yes gene_type:complete
MKTKEKIIQKSLSLFNNTTFELTTTNLIAKKSGVLEGSLWYHFNSKSDLVSEHTKLFLNAFSDQKKYLEKNAPQDLIQGLFSMYEVLWDYRYLMRDSFEQIATDDPMLYKKIIDINCSIDHLAKDTIFHSKDVGVLIIDEKDINDIVEITLIILRHWLDYSMKKYPSKSNVYLRKKGINLLIKTLYPYLGDESKKIMDFVYVSDQPI